MIPQINYNPNISTEENIRAIVNWTNFLLREMSGGRVPQAQADIRTAQGEINSVSALADNTDAQALYTAMMTDTLLESEEIE